jgi:hypothetical protein
MEYLGREENNSHLLRLQCYGVFRKGRKQQPLITVTMLWSVKVGKKTTAIHYGYNVMEC